MSDLDEINRESEAELWMQRYKYQFTDERQIPSGLIELLSTPNLTEDLRKAIIQARDELEQRGAVAYPTISRVEYYLQQFVSRKKGRG